MLLLNTGMKSFLRWIGVAALAVSVSARDRWNRKSFKGPLGLQLYSLRGDLDKDVQKGLDEAKDFGFKEVELAGTYKMPPEKFKEELEKRGLKAISGHFPYADYKNNPESGRRGGQGARIEIRRLRVGGSQRRLRHR